MTARRTAIGVLIALLVIGIVGQAAVWQVIAENEVAWSGREPGEAALTAFALMQLGWGVGAPAFATLTAASAFSLAVVGARAIAERWTAQRSAEQRSHGRADDERSRLDVEVRAHD